MLTKFVGMSCWIRLNLLSDGERLWCSDDWTLEERNDDVTESLTRREYEQTVQIYIELYVYIYQT